MSINKLISIRNPIINALSTVGDDRAKDMPIYVNWAMEAEKEIGGIGGFVKKKKILDIIGCKAEIPCDAVFMQMAIMGAQDCNCDDLSIIVGTGNFIVNNATTKLVPPLTLDQSGFAIFDFNSNAGMWNIVDFEIQNNQMVFATNQDKGKVTIQYLGIEVDCDGFPMISENHVRAIEHYILYRYALRSRFSQKSMPLNEVDYYKTEWFRLCKHARADDAELTPTDRLDIVSAINNPHAGHSLSEGMFYVFRI